MIRTMNSSQTTPPLVNNEPMSGWTLYSHPESGHSYKVKLALSVLGLLHRDRVVNIALPAAQRADDFRRVALFDEVPVLVHDRKVLVQSNAILLYLAQHTGRWGGESGERMQETTQWLFWEANRLGLSLPHLRFAKRFDAASYPPGALDWLRQRFDQDIARLAHTLGEGQAFVLGEQPSMADVSLSGYLWWADQAGLTLPSTVRAWLVRLSDEPGWISPADMPSLEK
ncbi:MAG: glutathione S-transferase family protein [Hydrogenophaga sp.]|nr:glutathione S-transferase family protein [Hydrogenophaga sp.]MDZ4161263.1 glutathione S-transferase family protein [Burkholderiales bacterium]